jgi:hypothetical protein
MNYYTNSSFELPGYEFYFTRHAEAILESNYPEAKEELLEILDNFYIEENDIISGGGGKAKITQRLEQLLYSKNWKKRSINDQHIVEGVPRIVQTHEIDHYRGEEIGSIALEIEWNNKDPFYDRDLENFRNLHYIGAIGLGIIFTRGASLQQVIPSVFAKYLDSLPELTLDVLKEELNLSSKAAKKYSEYFALPKPQLVRRLASLISQSKFGQATTHMEKLLLRIDRGVGNPCPMILIGVGSDRIQES